MRQYEAPAPGANLALASLIVGFAAVGMAALLLLFGWIGIAISATPAVTGGLLIVVLFIAAVGAAGIVSGHVARRRARRVGGLEGVRLAVAGLALGYGAIALLAAAAAAGLAAYVAAQNNGGFLD